MASRSVAPPSPARRSAELGDAEHADAIRGELGAQVRAALLGLAHAADDLLEGLLGEGTRRDDDALLLEACGCRRASSPGSARRRRRGGRGWPRSRAGPRRVAKAGVMTVMSGRWVPPAKGSLRIQETPGRCSSSTPPPPRRASRRGGRGCARPASPSPASASNSAVEASRRSLMFEEWAERISTTPISRQAARSAPVSDLELDRIEHRSGAWRLDGAVVVHARRPARGDEQGGSRGAAHRAGPSIARPGSGLAAVDRAGERLAAEDHRSGLRGRRAPRGSTSGAQGAGRRPRRTARMLTSSTSASSSR